MLHKLLACAGVALVLAPATASAQGRPLTESSRFDSRPAANDGSSAELLQACGGGAAARESRPSVACIRYLDGMLSMHALMVGFGAKPQFCLPSSGIRLDEARRALLDYMAEHPQALQETARINVVIALREAFPCKDEPPRPERRPPRSR